MAVTSAVLPVPAGQWVEQWLSSPRHGKYLRAATNDADRARALYEWNAQLSAALMRDLAHLEVGLRNAYDAAITRHWTGSDHWTRSATRLFPPLYRTNHGRRVDVNERRRSQTSSRVRTGRAFRAAGQGRRGTVVRLLALPQLGRSREVDLGSVPTPRVSVRHRSEGRRR